MKSTSQGKAKAKLSFVLVIFSQQQKQVRFEHTVLRVNKRGERIGNDQRSVEKFISDKISVIAQIPEQRLNLSRS